MTHRPGAARLAAERVPVARLPGVGPHAPLVVVADGADVADVVQPGLDAVLVAGADGAGVDAAEPGRDRHPVHATPNGVDGGGVEAFLSGCSLVVGGGGTELGEGAIDVADLLLAGVHGEGPELVGLDQAHALVVGERALDDVRRVSAPVLEVAEVLLAGGHRVDDPGVVIPYDADLEQPTVAGRADVDDDAIPGRAAVQARTPVVAGQRTVWVGATVRLLVGLVVRSAQSVVEAAGERRRASSRLWTIPPRSGAVDGSWRERKVAR